MIDSDAALTALQLFPGAFSDGSATKFVTFDRRWAFVPPSVTGTGWELTDTVSETAVLNDVDPTKVALAFRQLVWSTGQIRERIEECYRASIVHESGGAHFLLIVTCSPSERFCIARLSLTRSARIPQMGDLIVVDLGYAVEQAAAVIDWVGLSPSLLDGHIHEVDVIAGA